MIFVIRQFPQDTDNLPSAPHIILSCKMLLIEM